jgi:diguanylate cyclase (GGDEF)-like protein
MTKERTPGRSGEIATSGDEIALEHVLLLALRGEFADRRDSSAIEPDHSSNERDLSASRSDAVGKRSEDLASHAESNRADPFSPGTVETLGSARRDAVVDRDRAKDDCRLAAADQSSAPTDRGSCALGRGLEKPGRVVSLTDKLTGALSQPVSLCELERDVRRAKREGIRLVLGFVDVDGSKAANDSFGHAQGDHVLQQVAHSLRTHLRSYDPIVRFGGDEFVFTASGLSLRDAESRAASINDVLLRHGISITIGFSEMGGEDTLTTLLERAEARLSENRRRARSEPPRDGRDRLAIRSNTTIRSAPRGRQAPEG